ncbi:LysR family transcriptional regulator [Solimonas terrae]|uniref:LysR family transcriptional regulator n=1 Tax=Solimonas terrae TaxID=1396819 RepID=A0A6M2BN08_9GAMM|nr:LysR family transcriptional regulator [Solimonas terrae]NGY03996.1 LysR family transcriptional regulator [Solimonas terrae]
MDLKQLRVFVMVARHGSITRAADAIHLTQSALSLQLKALQKAIGAPLFRRTPRGMELLPSGRALLPHAQAVLAAVDDFDSAVAGLSRQVSGRLRLGTILDPDFLRLGALLGLLLERHPGLHTDVSYGISGGVLSQLFDGQLDLGFYLGVPGDKRLHVMQLTSFRYRVAAPRDWQGRVADADWPQLVQLPWIWTPPESVHHRLLAARFAAQAATPRIVAQVDVESSMLDLVRAGVGLSLLRDTVAQAQHGAGHIALAPPTLDAELTLVCLQRRAAEPAIAAAFALADELWRA